MTQAPSPTTDPVSTMLGLSIIRFLFDYSVASAAASMSARDDVVSLAPLSVQTLFRLLKLIVKLVVTITALVRLCRKWNDSVSQAGV